MVDDQLIKNERNFFSNSELGAQNKSNRIKSHERKKLGQRKHLRKITRRDELPAAIYILIQSELTIHHNFFILTLTKQSPGKPAFCDKVHKAWSHRNH